MANYVFLKYINRSGSTLLSSLLSSFAEVCVCPEADVLWRTLLRGRGCKTAPISKRVQVRLRRALAYDAKLKHWQLRLADIDLEMKDKPTKEEVFFSVLRAYCRKTRPSASTIVFKGGTLQHLIPRQSENDKGRDKFKTIFLVRDPRGIFESQYRSKSSSAGLPMQKSPRRLSLVWSRFASEAAKMQRDPSVLLVKYEDLVRDPNRVMCVISQKLELKESRFSFSDYYNRIPGEQRHLHRGILQPIDKGKSESWRKRLSSSDVYLLQKKAARYMTYFGYELMKVEPKMIDLVRTLILTEVARVSVRGLALWIVGCKRLRNLLSCYKGRNEKEGVDI